ncbi:hypothetical protein [Paenibacillus sp. y28]|uniref:hypothetical protein n=1 Tax=Paenibacillus sp. y28 TaxID=3129110 RepID=UPI0030191C5A
MYNQFQPFQQTQQFQNPSYSMTGSVVNNQRYQPTGFVQSYYDQYQQNHAPMQFGAGQAGAGFSQAGQLSYNALNQPSFVNPNAYHTANYRGNIQGHDSYLRSDSQMPSQQYGMSSYGAGQTNAGFSSGASYQPIQNAMGYGQQASAQSYHLANYRGNIQGHDQYLRENNQNQFQASGGYASQFQGGMNRGF